MLGKFSQKSTIWFLISCFAVSCAPKYSANFQLKSHEMNRYAEVEPKEKDGNQVIASIEKMPIEEEIVINEVITEPEQIDRILSEASEQQVIKPQSKEELIETLKNNPDATLAFNPDELTRKERRALKKEVKKQFKEADEAGVLQYDNEPSKLLYIILAVLLSPLSVALWRGIGKDFWINLLLWLLLILPGIIHAIIVISTKPKTTGTGAAY